MSLTDQNIDRVFFGRGVKRLYTRIYLLTAIDGRS